jgi:hypothetical protein
MTEVLAFLAALVLVPVYGWAAVAKSVRPGRWRAALSVYRLPRVTEPIVFVAAPVAEAAIVGLILAGATKPAGALSVGLLCSFCAALLRARSKEGDRLPCGCFGGNRTRDYRLLLLRNIVLLVPSVTLMVSPPGSVTHVPSAIEPIPALLALIGLGVLLWMALEIARVLIRNRAG